MEKLLKISVIYCCLAATSRKCKITLYGCHSPSQHRKPSLNFDAVALGFMAGYRHQTLVFLYFVRVIFGFISQMASPWTRMPHGVPSSPWAV